VAWLQAELARLGGELERATEVLAPVLEKLDPDEADRYSWSLLWLAARIEAERAPSSGDSMERADRLVTSAQRMAVTTPADRGHRALVLAEYARTAGTGEVDAWTAAVEACRSMNEAFPLAYALLRRTEALVAAGERASAGEALAESARLAEDMGAMPLLDEIRAFGRAARLTPDAGAAEEAAPEPANGGPDELAEFGLTSREREVLTLIADGRSNGQIADELVISRKTASVHVSNILAKLGVSTRVEAAALAHRRGLTRARADA
jgi:DNA-binding NarL/FixJ family response regulator